MCKKAIVIFLSYLLGSTDVTAANLYSVPAPGGIKNGYVMYGNLNASDLHYSDFSGRWAKLHAVYETTDSIFWENRDDTIACTADREESLRIINKRLSDGIFLRRRVSYQSQRPWRLNIYCISMEDGIKTGSWEINPFLPIPPVQPESPRCNSIIEPNVNFGTVTLGQTAKTAISGIITCDKDATVNISMINQENVSAKDGILKLDDATVSFNIDGASISKKYNVLKEINETFTLNFELTDTGTRIGHKTGGLIIKIEIL